MFAIDTNILIRFLVKDDIKQADLVYQQFIQAEQEKQEFFVPLLVVLEMIWVLQSAYKISDQDIVSTLSDLLQMPVLKFQAPAILHQFINSANKTNFDLSDVLIAHAALFSECQKVLTFDKKASKFKHFKLLDKTS